MIATKPQFTSEAGPRQTKRVAEAIRALEWRGKTRVQLSGTVGGPEHRAELVQPFSETSPEATAALNSIGEQFGWRITADNHGELVTALELATRNLQLPVDDVRETSDETTARMARQDERQREREQQDARIRESHAALMAKMPAGATAVILAELDQDDSDSMSDYHNHKTTRVVAIGWRTGKREDFRQLRKAAAGFPETAHLGPEASEDVEHRENWSMGSGNYVKAGHDDSTGWRVVSREPGRLPHHVIEDALPTAAPAESATTAAYRIEKHRHTKRGFDMYLVILSNRVDRAEFDTLRAGCEAAGGWYSRQWGTTPGGFAFKDETAAKTWALCLTPAEAPAGEPAPATTAPAGNKIAARLRELADAMTEQIEYMRRPMTQNPTPKRMKEYNGRLHDAENAERCQRAMRGLADAHDAGTITPELAQLRTKAMIGPMVAHGLECRGYYDVVSSGKYRDTSPTAVALQQRMDGAKTAAQQAQDAEREAADKLRRMEDELRFIDIPGFFPTPRPVIDTMISYAAICPSHSILEPSAGKGDIADAIREITGKPVAVCEVVPRLRDILEAKGHSVQPPSGETCDFLACRFTVDRIVMNPPFERGQDAEHIRHAFDCLAPGGRLVAICSAGPFHRSDNRSASFREWLESVGAAVEDLPADAFKGPDAFRQTAVATKLLTIDKPV